MSLCGLSKVINLSRHHTSWLYYLEKICKDNVCIKKIKQFYSWRTLWNIKERRVLPTSMWKRSWVDTLQYRWVQFSSVTQSCPTLCDPMNRSTPGLPVHHQLPEFNQTHIHWVGDTIQPSHPLSSTSPPAFNLSQHQGLFKWVRSLHQMAKVLEFQLQHQSFQWTLRTGRSPLGWTGWISLQSKGL